MTTNAPAGPPPNALPPLTKPIRFVTNHDGPYAKRRRINSACLTCRKKKTRCSGERPVCGTCKQNKHKCAGYGADADAAADDATKHTKKRRRESTVSQAGEAAQLKQEPPQTPVVASSSVAPLRATPARNDAAISATIRAEGNSGLSLSTRNRMPYFRYFGPTAIMPGFKQMVVKVRGKQHSTGHTSSEVVESSPQQPSVGSPFSSEFRTPADLPVYDTSSVSPSPLITHLCKLFVVHLGCSFPFLQPERFLRDLEEKQVDAILVDAVCALAARFSTHPLLTGPSSEQRGEKGQEAAKLQPWEYGQAFAQRAKSAITDAFHCPSVAVVQAALLLAWDEFGASRDSGLWMYLGIAIRMAQDLGMQTLEGLRYEGRQGPTPKTVNCAPRTVSPHTQSIPIPRPGTGNGSAAEAEEQRAVERERLDTFWSIFFLDRVISSGTGRPVTLRDNEIEIAFPSLDEVDPVSGWPLPFPALIRIIHLYGQVTDLLNSIKEKAPITEELRRQLDALEYHLTEIYQGLSPRLHFNALNFQHYAKMNQGTNFLLLHCWFHTLIVLLHQPTLLKTFEGSVTHISSNSRELSMSSAKTIADILAFAELIDAKTAIGSPFTSQPIYIAACAFLKETALHSASSQEPSRPNSPTRTHSPDPASHHRKQSLDHLDFDNLPTKPLQATRTSQTAAQKHTLLASAANQNYQRCYRALKSLETYWAGVKYILTVLDQKAKGVGDPLLYTREEMESALEAPRTEAAFTRPGWRRKAGWGPGEYLTVAAGEEPCPTMAGSPLLPPLTRPSQAIGWSLTGTMNSPSTNVAVMYSNNPDANSGRDAKVKKEGGLESIASVLANNASRTFNSNSSSAAPSQQQHLAAAMPPPSSTIHQSLTSTGMNNASLVSDADLLLNFHSPSSFAATSPGSLTHQAPPNVSPVSSFLRSTGSSLYPPSQQPEPQGRQQQSPSDMTPTTQGMGEGSLQPIGEMVIDSQDVDMSTLGTDMLPWDLEYLPQEMMFYGDVAASGGFGVDEQHQSSEEGT